MSSATASWNKFLRSLESRGFRIDLTNGGHRRITHPDMQRPVFTSGSPSDVRTQKNLISEIRRNGGKI